MDQQLLLCSSVPGSFLNMVFRLASPEVHSLEKTTTLTQVTTEQDAKKDDERKGRSYLLKILFQLLPGFLQFLCFLFYVLGLNKCEYKK